MSWTVPASYTTNEVVTASKLNTHIRDNMLALPHIVGSREYAEKGVQNSITETSLYTTAPVIPGNTLGTGGTFHAIMMGRTRQGTTSALNWTWRIKLGGSAVITDGPTAGGGGTSTEGLWWCEVFVEAAGATNSQRVWWRADNTALYARVPSLLTATSAVDMTADQTFDITAQMGTAGTNDLVFKNFSKQYIGQN